MSETTANEPDYAGYVALDWADREHAWAREVPGSSKRESGKLKQTPEALEAWAVELAVRFGGRPIAVGLEQSHGALIYGLQKYSHLVLYPIHPSTSSRYRAALFPGGGKNDPLDADLLLDLLVRHRDRLRRLEPDSQQTRKLQMLVEKRRQLVEEQTAQTNRLTDLLKIYFPQALTWLDELSAPLALAFLQRWPTLTQLQKEDPAVVRQFFYQHGSRSAQRIETRLTEIRQARPALEDEAIGEPCVLMVRVLLQLLTAVRQGIAQLQQACQSVFAAHPDAEIFASFPGAGPALAPRLLAAFGSRRERWASAAEFQPYTGIPPVTVRSGASQWIHFRGACPKFLRQSFHEFAAHSIQQSAWAGAFYDHQRQVAKLKHHAAVRSLAYKWQRILFACWKSRTPYQESFHQERLLRRQSPPFQQAPADQPAHPKLSGPATSSSSANPVSFQFKKVAGFWKLSAASS
jgi:transposase